MDCFEGVSISSGIGTAVSRQNRHFVIIDFTQQFHQALASDDLSFISFQTMRNDRNDLRDALLRCGSRCLKATSLNQINLLGISKCRRGSGSLHRTNSRFEEPNVRYDSIVTLTGNYLGYQLSKNATCEGHCIQCTACGSDKPIFRIRVELVAHFGAL